MIAGIAEMQPSRPPGLRSGHPAFSPTFTPKNNFLATPFYLSHCIIMGFRMLLLDPANSRRQCAAPPIAPMAATCVLIELT